MKLIIALEKVGRFSVDLPEEQSKEKFKSIVVSLLDTKDVIKSEPKLNVPSNIEPRIEKIINEIQPNPIEEEPKIIYSDPKPVRKKLVLTKCLDCGQVMSPLVNDHEGQQIITCRSCGTDKVLNMSELKNAMYKCPSCEQTATFVTDGDIDMIFCKRCSSPIDMIYHEKKDMYMNPDLMK